MSNVRSLVVVASLLVSCGDSSLAPDETESSSGSESTGDGDGDGDGDTGDGDGDGDGDSGDGDGDTGDGDGDGDPTDLDDLLTFDHIQVKGTHNSYHVEAAIPVDPSLKFTHPPLDEQLENFGVRAFELDLHLGNGEVLVYHIVVVDDSTTCSTLVDCLSTIKTWSDQHPTHAPITVWFEIKDFTGGDPFTDLLVVDQTILDVFTPDRVITPDFVRGPHDTLREAIETDGWPTLGEIRGKIAFVVLNGDHAAVPDYTYGNTSLLGRMMFVGVDDFTLPYAGFSKINDAADPLIADAHAAGILTASNVCNAGGDEAECFAKLAAGQMTGTHGLMDDFLAPVDPWTYFLDLPDGNPARCNEVTAPPECTSQAIEDLP